MKKGTKKAQVKRGVKTKARKKKWKRISLLIRLKKILLATYKKQKHDTSKTRRVSR